MMTGKTRRLIVLAARRFAAHLRRENGGRWPGSDQEWHQLCERMEVWAGPIECPPSFRARLWYVEDCDLWIIGYNRRGTPAQVSRWLCHELFEWLAVSDRTHLFDGLPGLRSAGGEASPVYYYDGGAEPEAIHHLIGRRGEKICFRRL